MMSTMTAITPNSDRDLFIDTTKIDNHDTRTLSTLDPGTPSLKQHSSMSTARSNSYNSSYKTKFHSRLTSNELFNDTLSTIAVDLDDDFDQPFLTSSNVSGLHSPTADNFNFNNSPQLHFSPSMNDLSSSSSHSSNNKKSFARIKQVKELLNTEDIYLKSLNVLKETYIDNAVEYTNLPQYFHNFKKCVDQLISQHTTLLDDLIVVYQKLINNYEFNFENSPNLDNYQPNEHEELYLLQILTILNEKAINVDTYCRYCQLYTKVLSFPRIREIERYKTQSIRIEGDFTITDMTGGGFIDGCPINKLNPKIDSRFTSLIQMPTIRPSRYGLMVGSLKDKCFGDSLSNEFIQKLTDTLHNINENCFKINNHLRLTEIIKAKNSIFANISQRWMNYNLPNHPCFLDDLNDLVFSGAFQIVWKQRDNVQSEFMSVYLFENHLILGKLNKFGNSLDIKFIIPLLSIWNVDQFNPSEDICYDPVYFNTKFPFAFNLQFEENEKIFEILCLFPNSKEQESWTNKIATLMNKLGKFKSSSKLYHENTQEEIVYKYSYKKEIKMLNNSISLTPPAKYLNYQPDFQNFFKSKEITSGKPEFLGHESIIVLVKHFNFNVSKQQLRLMERSAAIPTSNAVNSITVTVKSNDRLNCQKLMGELWNNELPKLEESFVAGMGGKSISEFGGIYKKIGNSVGNLAKLNTASNSNLSLSANTTGGGRSIRSVGGNHLGVGGSSLHLGRLNGSSNKFGASMYSLSTVTTHSNYHAFNNNSVPRTSSSGHSSASSAADDIAFLGPPTLGGSAGRMVGGCGDANNNPGNSNTGDAMHSRKIKKSMEHDDSVSFISRASSTTSSIRKKFSFRKLVKSLSYRDNGKRAA